MIRYNMLGFLDHDAVKQHSIVLRQLIDRAGVHRLVEEMGETSPGGDISVDGHPFIWHDGYLTFPTPVFRRKAIDFIVRLARETGCDIADIVLGQILTPEAFRAHSELMSKLIDQTPSPFGE